MSPERFTVPPASVVTLPTLIPPPNVVAPAVLIVRSYAPLAPPLSATAPAPVLVSVDAAPKTAASL